MSAAKDATESEVYTMTIEEILSGESKNVEFKENLLGKSIKYMKSVVAFANGTGIYRRRSGFAHQYL